MNILILSSMTNPRFLDDFKLGNYLIGCGHNVLVADINQVNSSMDTVYDVVLYRNFVPQDILQYDSVYSLYNEKIALIPSVAKVYSKYNPYLYQDIAKVVGIATVDMAKSHAVGYGIDMPCRLRDVDDTTRFILQKEYKKDYHTIVADGNIVYTYLEENGIRKIVDVVPSFTPDIISNMPDYDMYEIIYVLDDMGEYRLSFIDVTYISLDVRVYSEDSLFTPIISLIERKK